MIFTLEKGHSLLACDHPECGLKEKVWTTVLKSQELTTVVLIRSAQRVRG
jgi:hypothetical protein